MATDEIKPHMYLQYLKHTRDVTNVSCHKLLQMCIKSGRRYRSHHSNVTDNKFIYFSQLHCLRCHVLTISIYIIVG